MDNGGDKWEISSSRVRLGEIIGSGAFGVVYKAKVDMPGAGTLTVAAKTLPEDAYEEEMHDFLREIEMLKNAGSHKHVIGLIGCCTKQLPLMALLEHAPRGDLHTLLQATRKSASTLKMKSSDMSDYALQVALGMRHLEKREITHRDLAARNILVDGTGVLKVADFGLSRTGVYVLTRKHAQVPLRWLAPEAIDAQYSTKSDVWAFGVLLWEIATLGGFPYAELSNQQLQPYLEKGKRLSRPARASPNLYQLMVACWAADPPNRPSFAQIVERLKAQKMLYVDMDCVLPPTEDEVLQLPE